MSRSVQAGAAVAAAPVTSATHRVPRRRREFLVVGGTAALGLVHALVVAPHYGVGSFDDDASYVMTARALAHGTGLAGTLPIGYPVAATYPPGFALLLAPLALVAGSATWPYRALILLFFVALFPLTWLWLRRTGAPGSLRAGVLLLLALNPVAATFATMVMAEAPFLAALLGTVLLASRWARQARGLTVAGFGTVLLAAALLWLKQAGVGLVAGLALWLVLQRRWRRAAALLAGVALGFAPVLALRAVAGTPLTGARYSTEIGSSGGLGAVPGAVRDYVLKALPRSVLPPVGVPLPVTVAVIAAVCVLVAVGAAAALHRTRDVATVMTLVYLAETLVYPYTNERRLILVLPVVLAWFVVGAWTLLHGADALAAGRGWRIRPERPLAILGAVLALALLAVQFDRDYLLRDGDRDTGRPLGSAYLGFLTAVTGPDDVIETPYVWTTALGTGRRVAGGLFIHTDPGTCSAEQLRQAARADGAGFAVDAAWNFPPPVDDCPSSVLDSVPWAVPLYRDPVADATVWQFIGPGTAHPGLRDSITGPGTAATAGDAATRTWQWAAPRLLTQLSVGSVRAATGRTSAAELQWQAPDGGWHRAASADGAVGPDAATRWLLWQPATPVAVTGVRLVVSGGAGVEAAEVHALTREEP